MQNHVISAELGYFFVQMLNFCSLGPFSELKRWPPRKFNIFNISAERRPMELEMCFFLLKCWICWIMLDLVSEECASFCWNVEYVDFFGSMGGQKGPNRGKIIQHIQHIQHFSRKKHFFGKRRSAWSNIFNISAERSTIWKKGFFQGKIFNIAQKVVLSAEKIQHVPKMCFFLLKCWICWIMLDLVSEICASFCWNVEYVEFFWVYGRPNGTK